jgi:hypothetical protein
LREPGAPLKSFCSSTNEGDEYGNDFRNLSQGLSQSVLEGLGSLKVNGSSPEDEDMVQSSQEGAWCRSCSCSCPVIVISAYVRGAQQLTALPCPPLPLQGRRASASSRWAGATTKRVSGAHALVSAAWPLLCCVERAC